MKSEDEIREIVQTIFDEGYIQGAESECFVTVSEEQRIQKCIKKLKEWLE